MNLFKKIALLESINEALKIVKKNNDERENIKTDIAKKEMSSAKKKNTGYDPRKNPLYVGDVNGLPVVKSKHTQEIRSGEKKPRDRNIKDELIIKVLNKMMTSGEFKPNKMTIVIYKNTKGRFDMMAVKQERGTILIITFIQERKKDPYDYFTKKHQRDPKIIIESEVDSLIENIIIVTDDLVDSDTNPQDNA